MGMKHKLSEMKVPLFFIYNFIYLFISCCSGSSLLHVGLAARCCVRSPQTRDWTRVPRIGRGILNHWTTREVYHSGPFLKSLLNLLQYCFCLRSVFFFFGWEACTPCIGRWSLNHWTTREVPKGPLSTLRIPWSLVAKPFRALAFVSRKCVFQSVHGQTLCKRVC